MKSIFYILVVIWNIELLYYNFLVDYGMLKDSIGGFNNMTEQAQNQYNAILLLTSYLQRVNVSEMVKVALKKKETSRAEEASTLLADVSMMREMFEGSQQLIPTQQAKLLDITSTVIDMMTGFIPAAETADFDEKLILVAASLFGEQTMNNGILRMEQVFGLQIKGDFKERVTYYQERTMMLDQLIGLREAGKELDAEFVTMIEQWFTNITQNPHLVIADLYRIKDLLA